jgi:mono/diheme cytochrome c family protein
MRITSSVALVCLTLPADAGASEFFEKHVRPVLAERCYSCHGPKLQRGGLRLDSRQALLRGGDSGPAIVPGKPEASLLLRAVRRQGDVKMPPKEKNRLEDAAVAALAEWVRQGAPWPADAKLARTSSAAEARPRHWAFQPVRRPPVPNPRNDKQAENPVDAFLLDKLGAKGLSLSPEAGRRTLIRRLTFDLLGLPPAPEEVEAFVGDNQPGAYERLVERLLASPAYGERWGRHWLDVARYADTKGYVFQEERRFPYSYTYRDYVIAAFNADLPYQRFILEQLAADRLPLGDDHRPLAAMGFLTLGRRFLNNTHDIIDDRIDVVSRGLMGLTVGCARCHDHKYDPIPMRDYYSLYGVFASSREPEELPLVERPDPTRGKTPFELELEKRQRALDEYLAKELKAAGVSGNLPFREALRKLDRDKRNRAQELKRRVEQWRVNHPGGPARAMALVDAPQPFNPQVFLRGNPNTRGVAVPRQFLEVLDPDRKPFTAGSGRLELARAIADPKNPLTARVMVNRVWMHHFGKGLVVTPGDFGTRGEPPTHPELLDWLADEFVRSGWSVKRLHRLIVLSAAYRQASDERPEGQAIDPENTLLWRMNRRRLEFEPLRDAMLAAAGTLDRRMGGPGVDVTKPPYPPVRSVYAFIERQNLPGVFRTFDLASPDVSTPRRHATTVPPQALFLMNSPFVQAEAKALAARADVAGQPDDRARVERLHRLVYGRGAEPEELALGLAYVGGVEPGRWERYAQVLLMANEFAFVD